MIIYYTCTPFPAHKRELTVLTGSFPRLAPRLPPSLPAACRGLVFVAGLLWACFRGPNLYVLITTYQSLITAYNKLITDKLRASQAYKSLAKS